MTAMKGIRGIATKGIRLDINPESMRMPRTGLCPYGIAYGWFLWAIHVWVVNEIVSKNAVW